MKPSLHQAFGGLQGADRIGQKMSGVRNHLQLDEGVLLLPCQLGQLPSKPGDTHRFLRIGAACGVGQHPDSVPVDGFHQALMACCNGLHPSHSHRDHVAAGSLDALLHQSHRWVFAGAREQTAVELTPANG